MDGWKYSTEIITVPLKERIRTNFFLEINILLLKELLKQWMTTASSPVKIYTVHFKEWITAILSVIKIDTLLQWGGWLQLEW